MEISFSWKLIIIFRVVKKNERKKKSEKLKLLYESRKAFRVLRKELQFSGHVFEILQQKFFLSASCLLFRLL